MGDVEKSSKILVSNVKGRDTSSKSRKHTNKIATCALEGKY
jgi:hypothetical protein